MYVVTKTKKENRDMLSLYYTDMNLEGIKYHENEFRYNTIEEIEDLNRYRRVKLENFSQKQFDLVMTHVCKDLTRIELFKCPNIGDMDILSTFEELRYVIIYWNKKLTKLWQLNTNLAYLRINETNTLKDIESLRDSNVEELILTSSGENLTSNSAKLRFDDVSPIYTLNRLEKLTLMCHSSITNSDFLLGVSQMNHLKELHLLIDAYTFEEFAWLKSKLEHTVGLECIESYFGYYSVIGIRKPRMLSRDDARRVNNYRNLYDGLIEKYRNQSQPPKGKKT